MRSETPPGHPVIVRADALNFADLQVAPGGRTARVRGAIAGEIVVRAPQDSIVLVDGKPHKCRYDSSTQTFTVPVSREITVAVEVRSN
jgi:hypothetical protein